jgi:hypothetical protein
MTTTTTTVNEYLTSIYNGSLPSDNPAEDHTNNKKSDHNTHWFTSQEYHDLLQKPMVIDYFNPKDVPKDTVLDGSSLTRNMEASRAVTRYQRSLLGHDLPSPGVESYDPILQSSKEEISRFLNTYNSRPILALTCTGFHVQSKQTLTGVINTVVTDWIHIVDLTPYIFPFGYISPSDAVMMDSYISSCSSMKTLYLKKEVMFDFKDLKHLVREMIIANGWPKSGFNVDLNYQNSTVKVWKSDCMSDMYENRACYCCMACCILPACIMSCSHKSNTFTMHSKFKILGNASQIFQTIKVKNPDFGRDFYQSRINTNPLLSIFCL